MDVLLLPGLDGSGALFGPFLEALPAGVNGRPVRYSPDEWEYERLLSTLELPSGEFGIVAESFSGPLGVLLASRCSRVKWLVLAASFVTNPSRLTVASPVFPLLPRGVPSWALRHFLLGEDAPEAECERVRQVMAGVPPRTVARRLDQVRSVDVRAQLASLTLPKLLLRPERDRLIAPRAFDQVAALGTPVCRVSGAPHLVLQRAPGSCALACATLFG